MTAERSTFSEKGADHPYLWLDTTGSDDAPLQVNALKEAGTAAKRALSSRRLFAIAKNLVIFTLLASVPGTQAEHFLHKGDASFLHEEGFSVSAAEELFFSIAVDHHSRHSSLVTPDTFKVDEMIESLSASIGSLGPWQSDQCP